MLCCTSSTKFSSQILTLSCQQALKTDSEQPTFASALPAFGKSTHAEACVVGGGPAGLALAAELARREVDVVLIGQCCCRLNQDQRGSLFAVLTQPGLQATIGPSQTTTASGPTSLRSWGCSTPWTPGGPVLPATLGRTTKSSWSEAMAGEPQCVAPHQRHHASSCSQRPGSVMLGLQCRPAA